MFKFDILGGFASAVEFRMGRGTASSLKVKNDALWVMRRTA
jgi:hypothetical protein